MKDRRLSAYFLLEQLNTTYKWKNESKCLNKNLPIGEYKLWLAEYNKKQLNTIAKKRNGIVC